MRNLTGVALIALASASALHAQETTASLRGDVFSDAGAPVAGATVTITHTPSGTVSVQTTGRDGSFSANGLRIGGPVAVSVAAPGFETATTTVANLIAATPQRVSVALAAEGQVITVTGTRQRSSIVLATGPVTALDRDRIEGVASVNRDIRDLARRDPLVTLDPTNRGISIAGQNGRFNKFSVDGVQFSDDFGINQGGLPTQRGPVPLDAICEFTVEVAPTDITQGDFQGGAINTVLCSGTNEYHGSAFFTYSEDSLTGDRTRDTQVNLSFDSKNYGFSLRGPIVKDRLFLAVTGERLREGRTADYGPQGEGFANPVPGVTRALVDLITADAKSIYGYDTLDIPSSVLEKDDKLVAKADWNIVDGQRLSATYVYNDSSNFQDGNSGNSISRTSPFLALQSNSYALTETVHSGVIQLNSDWSDIFSTEARVSYRDYKRGQVPYNGRSFGQFTVCTAAQSDSTSGGGGTTGCNIGVPTIQFGPDASRQANELETKNLDIQLQAEVHSGGHAVKALFERNQIDVNNLFAQNTAGVFYFDSIADYEARRANRLAYNVPINGDINSVAAIFNYQTYTFGLQDTWDVTDTLTVQYGFRYDLYEQKDRPTANQNFANRQERIAAGATGSDGQVIGTNTENIAGKQLFSPRFGLTWSPTDRLKISAGAGRFGGGTPDVYLSNSFSNTGIVSNQLTIQRNATAADVFNVPLAVGQGALNGVSGGPGIPAAVTQYLQTNTASVPLSTVNALDPNFKIPSVYRYSASATYKADLGGFGDDWLIGGDFVYTDVSNGFQVTDIRSIVAGTLPDGRPRYRAKTTATDTNGDYILYNSHRGKSVIAVGRFSKAWDFGLSLGASYTHTIAKAVSELTSSTSTSLYNQTAASDPNYAYYGTSNDEARHQIKWNAGFRTKLFGDNETRFDVFGERRSGRHFSYTAEDLGSATRSALYGVLGDDRRFLLYVPTGPNDPLVQYDSNVVGGVTVQTAAAAQSGLDALINNSKLKNFRGQVAPKNLGTSPWFTKVDIRVSQELPLVWGAKLKIFGDIENVLNLIDRNLGSYRVVNFPYFANVVQASCAAFAPAPNAGTCLKYSYRQVQDPTLSLQSRVSLYQIRVGAKLEF